jgi:hypothetical protein
MRRTRVCATDVALRRNAPRTHATLPTPSLLDSYRDRAEYKPTCNHVLQ